MKNLSTFQSYPRRISIGNKKSLICSSTYMNNKHVEETYHILCSIQYNVDCCKYGYYQCIIILNHIGVCSNIKHITIYIILTLDMVLCIHIYIYIHKMACHIDFQFLLVYFLTLCNLPRIAGFLTWMRPQVRIVPSAVTNLQLICSHEGPFGRKQTG